MTIQGRWTDERVQSLHRARDLGRPRFLPGRYGGIAALSRFAHPPARPHQGRQSRPRPGGARAAAAGSRTAGWPEARRRLAAGAALQRDSRADHRPRTAPSRATVMSVIEALDIGLASLVLAAAVWTIASRETFAAVVGYIVYGLLLALVLVRLFALDVALTEAAIGGGVTGVLLIGAAVRLRRTEALMVAERPGVVLRVLSAALCVIVAAGLAGGVFLMPDAGPTLAPQAAEHLRELGLGNAVTAVLIAYRALDTMLEKVVLILAVIGVWSLAADRYWGGVAGPRRVARPQGALAFLAQLLSPLGIVVAVHIVWVGANEPGGAFQGGAILAAMWMI